MSDEIGGQFSEFTAEELAEIKRLGDKVTAQMRAMIEECEARIARGEEWPT